jgi:hypothetical protein
MVLVNTFNTSTPCSDLLYNNFIHHTYSVKAHAGHERNELTDKLAKEATRENKICYSKFPRSEIEHQEREMSIKKYGIKVKTMG